MYQQQLVVKHYNRALLVSSTVETRALLLYLYTYIPKVYIYL